MILSILFIALIGLCIGSFANVLIYRIPNELSIIRPGSFCTVCSTKISWYCNIPVLSFIFLRGKCLNCKTKISYRYPLVEILSSALLVSVFLKYQDLNLFLIYGFFAFILLVISAIDSQYSIIPDVFSFMLIFLGLLVSPFNSLLSDSALYRILEAFVGMTVGVTILWSISFLGKIHFKKDAMGEGDIKLIAGIGAILGWEKVILTLFLGSLAGSIFSIALIYFFSKKKWGDYIPFGPFLALGAFISIFVPISFF